MANIMQNHNFQLNQQRMQFIVQRGDTDFLAVRGFSFDAFFWLRLNRTEQEKKRAKRKQRKNINNMFWISFY